MFNQKSILIVFINRNTLQLFGGNLTGIVTIEIPETILRDGEVISADGMYTLVNQLVKQYILTGTQLFLVLSDCMYFEKVFPAAEQALLENEILNFFTVVPYEPVLTKVYDTEKGKRAVAINRTLFETFKQGFLLQGIPIKAVVPVCLISSLSARHTLDGEMVSLFLRNMDTLTRQSISDIGEVRHTSPETINDTSSGKKKSQLPMLLMIFGVLIAILVIVVLMQGSS